MSLFSNRLKNIHKSLSMYGVLALGSLPAWWPLIEVAANGVFGSKAQIWAGAIIAIATGLGWAVPQNNIPHSKSTDG